MDNSLNVVSTGLDTVANNTYNYVLACVDKETYNYLWQVLTVNKCKDVVINNDTLIITYKYNTLLNISN